MKKNKRPNILFFLTDHQLHHQHGVDQGPKIQRPYFEKVASEGIDFSRAYSSNPVCSATRRTILTGLYSHTHGEVGNDLNHPWDRQTYLEVLSENGYQNYYYGKWHAGSGTAHDQGCEGFSYPSYSNPYTKPEYREYLKKYNLPEPKALIEHNFDMWKLDIKEGEEYTQKHDWISEHASGKLLTPKETHEAFFLANLACEKLEEIASSDSDEPFALRVDFWGPHPPYFPTQEYIDMYNPEDIPIYPSFDSDLSNKPDPYKREVNLKIKDENNRIIYPNPLPWSEWQVILARAYAHTTMVDDAAGLILKKLEELGLEEDTVVIFTTDHGDAVACHGGKFDKGSYMCEEILRVPLAIRYPGVIKPGQKCDAFVGNIDVGPTILDVVGLSYDQKVDGKSLLPLATGDVDKVRSYIVSETFGHISKNVAIALIDEEYKYVHNLHETHELYDLNVDPYELKNMINDEDKKDIVDYMQSKVDRWVEETNDFFYASFGELLEHYTKHLNHNRHKDYFKENDK